MTQFTATVSASSTEHALQRVSGRLPEGWTVTGEIAVRSERHLLWDVEVSGEGDRDALWVTLTSYGISPAESLGSRWQQVAGVGKF